MNTLYKAGAENRRLETRPGGGIYAEELMNTVKGGERIILHQHIHESPFRSMRGFETTISGRR
jgi:hypothetical protein